MRPLLLSLVLCGAFEYVSRQQTPPDTEIFLASFAREGDVLKLGTPVNITNSPGYDNQPSFTPDGRAVLFTSARNAAPAPDGSTRPPATDIYRFDIAAKMVQRLTATPEGEYSPTVTPDGRGISVIRVEADGTQRLWRFTLEGQDPTLLLRDVKPVGYHAWIDDRRLALFVLGEPATLQLVDRTTGIAEVIARDIGRSVQRIPNGGVSYVQVERAPGERGVRSLTVMELDISMRAPRALVPVVAGAAEADLAWIPDGTLLMARGETLYTWRRGRPSWITAASLAELGLSGVTRLAVNPAGDRIAIVAQSKQP
jgi:dipeptidyl aminopeptidase/acylaminoacyl peptidase